MKRRKIASVLSTIAIASQMMVSVSLAQIATPRQNAQKLSKTNLENDLNSKYLQDVAQMSDSVIISDLNKVA